MANRFFKVETVGGFDFFVASGRIDDAASQAERIVRGNATLGEVAHIYLCDLSQVQALAAPVAAADPDVPYLPAAHAA